MTDFERCLELLRVGDLVTPMVIRTASTLGLADQFGDEPLRADDLAARMAVPLEPLRRFLDALADAGMLVRTESGAFVLTDIGRVLRRDHPLSMRDAFDIAVTDIRAWAELEYSVRTGRSGFERAYGESYRSYQDQHPDEDARLDRAHQAATRLDLLTLARAYPWNDARTIVDVGGGTGTFLAGLLNRFPTVHGTLFDLPHMVANATDIVAAQGVADRCRIVGGDFFEAVPGGADLYILKAVVGGFDDPSCCRMLASVRRAMRPDSRLVVIEPIMGAGSDFSIGNVVQVHTLVLYGGRDRTVEDCRALGQAAGLAIRTVTKRSTLSILEFVPADAVSDGAPPLRRS